MADTATEPTAPVVRHRWLALGVLLTAVFMDLVDGTIVSIALPHIQRELNAGDGTSQWILAGYTVAFALVLITGGRLGDIYGRKRTFLIGTSLFTLASLVCGAAPTAEILAGARILQGISAAIMVPQVLSVVVVLFAQRERAKAFALYGIVLSLANVSGPLLGGILVQADLFGLGWRMIFFVNLPIGLLALFGGVRLLPESSSERPLRLDLTGVVLIALATFALMYPVIQGREAGWPMWLVVLLVLSVPLLLVFVQQQRKRHRSDGSALIPPPLFQERSFVVGLIVMLVLFSGLASLFLVLTYELQIGLGWSPLSTALVGIGWPIGIALTSNIAQRYAATHGRRLIGIGLLSMSVFMAVEIGLMYAAGAQIGFWQIALPILGVGLGMGLCISILTNVVLAAVPPSDAGAASGLTNAVLQLGAGLGVAIVGVIFFALVDAGAGTGMTQPELYTSAATTTLWYNFGVFTLAALLTPLLPRAARW